MSDERMSWTKYGPSVTPIFFTLLECCLSSARLSRSILAGIWPPARLPESIWMSDRLNALLVVSADLPDGPVANMLGPRKDYVALAEALGATVLDRTKVKCSVTSRLIMKVFGVSVA